MKIDTKEILGKARSIYGSNMVHGEAMLRIVEHMADEYDGGMRFLEDDKRNLRHEIVMGNQDRAKDILCRLESMESALEAQGRFLEILTGDFIRGATRARTKEDKEFHVLPDSDRPMREENE